jgi:hypothetical protein
LKELNAVVISDETKEGGAQQAAQVGMSICSTNEPEWSIFRDEKSSICFWPESGRRF